MFITLVYFLQGELISTSVWDKIKTQKSFQSAIKKLRSLVNERFDAMPFTAFTNYYKFVTKNRKSRIGGENRRNVNKELEDKLLLDELKILKPDILIFQSFIFQHKKYHELLDRIEKEHLTTDLWIAPHPSWRGSRVPEKYISNLIRVRN